ncbi:hypothetical protein CSIRO_0405 [Bradyrhizobiaceae bacterium SG-6C]|nr:hypothetical protein CSIRO_0405 [Bradyrhizobiaceae bacterium SG-6C]
MGGCGHAAFPHCDGAGRRDEIAHSGKPSRMGFHDTQTPAADPVWNRG